ncbi:MAG: hypothetical protein ABI678_26985 [Kofleriaceae bacterium]
MDESHRDELLGELGHALTERVQRNHDLDKVIAMAIAELRGLGHDLWSFDSDGEWEIWCPNYATPTGPGIIIHFSRELVSVSWTRRWRPALE